MADAAGSCARSEDVTLDARARARSSAVLGANGSGKSTLARLANGLSCARSGASVIVDGIDTRDDEPGSGRSARVSGWSFRTPTTRSSRRRSRRTSRSARRTSDCLGAEIRETSRPGPRGGRSDGSRAARAAPAFRGPEAASGDRRGACHAPRYLVLDEPTAMLDLQGRHDVLAVLGDRAATGSWASSNHARRGGAARRRQGGRSAARSPRIRGPAVGDLLGDRAGACRSRAWTLPPVSRLAAGCVRRACHVAAGRARAEDIVERCGLTLDRASATPTRAAAPFRCRRSAGVILKFERGPAHARGRARPAPASPRCCELAAGLLEAESRSVHASTARPINGILATRSRASASSSRPPKAQLFADTSWPTSRSARAIWACRCRGGTSARRRGACVRWASDPPSSATRSPFTLSGGEARRAAIAGVLAMRPRYLLLDEPTAGLDADGGEPVRRPVAGRSASAAAWSSSLTMPRSSSASPTASCVLADGAVVWSRSARARWCRTRRCSRGAAAPARVLRVQMLARRARADLGGLHPRSRSRPQCC